MNTQHRFSRRMGEQRPCDAEDANAWHPCKPPTGQRIALLLVNWGWVLALLAVLLLTGCADDLDTYAASQADLADAIATAAKEAGQ